MTEPHPLRCWTCEYHKFDKDAIYTTMWCEKHKEWIDPKYLNIVGCASHSSTTSAEQVLDELEKHLDYMTSMRSKDNIVYKNEVKKKIAVLRQQQEKKP
jgi:hypothetical protein